jgi:hypothetical protein
MTCMTEEIDSCPVEPEEIDPIIDVLQLLVLDFAPIFTNRPEISLTHVINRRQFLASSVLHNQVKDRRKAKWSKISASKFAGQFSVLRNRTLSPNICSDFAARFL